MNIRMNTKTSVFLGIASLAALAACSKVEPFIPDTPITFTVASYMPQTRADGDETTPAKSLFLEESNGQFFSKAFLHANGVTETQDFFGAYETIRYNGSTEWAPSHDYYWPKHENSYINFVSWFDKAANAATIAGTVTETTIKWANRTIAADDNIMFADAAWHYNKNPKSGDKTDNPAAGTNNQNPGPAGTFGNDGVTEGVPTLFHHALAKLSFKVAAAKVQGGTDNKTSWEITLSDMKLAGVYNTGTLELTTTAQASTGTSQWKTGTSVPAWTVSGDAADINMTVPSGALTTAAQDVLAEQSVLPQTVTDAMVLTFNYQVITKYDGTQYSKEIIPVSVKLNEFTGAIASWPMNTKITYTITIDPETTVVKFDPAVENWAVLNGGSYIVQ